MSESQEKGTENLPGGEEFTCWCGASGAYEALFTAPERESCGGSGYFNCYCGGDLCVCHNHGEIGCDGCQDCRDYDDAEA